ncbi:HlyD family secretion protein [Sphingopyxis fribergensis]
MFRSEAISHRADRLSGDIAIAVPISWQSIGYLIFGGVLVGMAFLSFTSYARVETVTGVIVPDKGVSAILPSRSGVIVDLAVKAGQKIPAGAALATIRAEEDGTTNISAAAQIESAIALQDASLSAQARAALSSAGAQHAQLAAQRSGLAIEIDQIEAQIALQHDLIASAQKDYERAGTIAARGFISQRDLQVREETLLVRRQGLAQLNQSLATKKSARVEAERSAAQIAAQSQVQLASLAASRAEVAQQAANTAGQRSYVLRAPVAGQVTSLTARIGQAANTQIPLMSIIPSGSVLRAELAVPSAAIGFVKVGQEVRLAVDAFPYQRFGTVKGRIVTVAGSSLNPQAKDGTTIAVYPVTVELDQSRIAAYGRREQLVSGMTLTARVVTEKQSMLQWLFEPLFAVQRR